VSSVLADPWRRLAVYTPARVGLGRAGTGLPTREVLSFALAHAQARDAVHIPLDAQALATAITSLNLPSIIVDSAATSRDIYLRRPDLGRRLAPQSRAALNSPATPIDVALVVADGLSSAAVQAHAVPFIEAFRPHADRAGWRLSPVIIAREGRVALGDEIGEILKARAVLMLIGERPGLSSPDSLGLYLTFAPRIGRTDAERNCISNIRSGGLAPTHAAAKAAWLVGESLRRRFSGVGLKDESELVLVEAAAVSPSLSNPQAEIA
jgi:ethanolamine ammonia-lyase small subunit